MKILIVDDEKKIADVLAERLKLRGFEAAPVYGGNSALDRLQAEHFDGVVLDLRLPDIDGMEVLKQAGKEFPDLKIIIVSGHATAQDFKMCLESGAIACFHKPAKISRLAEALTFARMQKDDESN